jgi:outer membrane receptor protein involved in Fe transport
MKHAAICWLVALAIATGAAGNESDPDAEKTEQPDSATTFRGEVVVTAAKSEQPAGAVTQSVRVISSEEIQALPLPPDRNLAEILAYQPGIFVLPLSRNDANWGSNGGLGPKYNSWLLDGLPIDSFIDAMGLDTAALERVEIQRGPAAVMYGNSLGMDFAGNQTPLAGITNFILRERVDAPLTRLGVGYGSWNTINASAYRQGRVGKLHHFFGGSWERSDYTDYGTPGSWLNILDDPQYTKIRLYGKGALLLDGDRALSLFVHYTSHSGDVGRPNRDYSHEYGIVNLAYRQRLGDDVDLRFAAGARTVDRRWGEDRYPASLALREHDGVEQDVYPFDLGFTWRQSERAQLGFGVDYQIASYRTYAEVDGVRTTGNDADANALGIYAEERFVLGELVLRGGIRWTDTGHSYDRLGGAAPGLDDASWNEVLWSAGARWNAGPNWALFANAGTSFVAPTPKAVGGTLAAGDLGVPGRNGQLPNPDLEPEGGLGADLGLEVLPAPTMHLEARGFVNRIDDVIVDNVVSQNPSQTRSVNAGNATAWGLELAFEHGFSENLRWFANGTLTRSEINNPLDPDQDGAELPFVPDWMANLGASVTLGGRVVVSPYLRAVGAFYDSSSISGRQEFGSYVVPALRVEGAIDTGAGTSALLALDLNNLTDERYEMPWQFRDPGFNAFGSVTLRLP